MAWKVEAGSGPVWGVAQAHLEPTGAALALGAVPGWPAIDPELLWGLAEPRATGGGVPAHRLHERVGPLQALGGPVARWMARLFGSGPPPEGAELVARAQVLEDRAFEVLEVLTPKRIGEAEAAFAEWFGEVEGKALRGERLNALEHLTVLHILKQGLFEGRDGLRDYVPRLEAVIQRSDARLLKKTRPLDRILAERMPRSYLAGQSSDARKIHAAIFATKDPTFLQTLNDFAKDYIPGKSDPIVAVGVLATLFTGTGAHLLAGAIHGYLLATLIEHTIHEKLGHASPRSLERLEEILSRFGPLGRAIHEEIKEIAISHGTIHHGSYAGSYVDRFAPRDTALPADERDRLRAKKKEAIDKQVASMSPRAQEDVVKSDYGRKLAHALRNALFTAPVSAILSTFTAVIANQLGLELGPLFVAASTLSSLIFVPASNSLHPYLHMTREEAFAKAGPAMRAFLDSEYVGHVARAHYLHHRVPGVNHNLVAGADYVVGYAPSPVDAIVALRKLKTFY